MFAVSVGFTLLLGHDGALNTYLAEEMTTECCSELRIFVRWAATESS